MVVPIFYDVKLSAIRNQTGSVGQALAKLEAKFKDDVKLERWKKALKNVANLAGHHLRNRNESIFIEEIIQELRLSIKSRAPQDISLLKVGMKDQLSAWTICAGCNTEIGFGPYWRFMGDIWQPQCFRCHAYSRPTTGHELCAPGNRPYHKSCYEAQWRPRCDVWKNFIPPNSEGLVEYRAHPFCQQKYCTEHERDGTPRCYSCDRMEPRDMRHLSFGGGWKQCLECRESAIMFA